MFGKKISFIPATSLKTPRLWKSHVRGKECRAYLDRPRTIPSHRLLPQAEVLMMTQVQPSQRSPQSPSPTTQTRYRKSTEAKERLNDKKTTNSKSTHTKEKKNKCPNTVYRRLFRQPDNPLVFSHFQLTTSGHR